MSTRGQVTTKQDYEARANKFYQAYYGQLEGVRIVKFLGMKSEEYCFNPFPTFLVEYPDGERLTIQVSQDEEGNGGGFLLLPFEPDFDSYDKEHKLNNYANKENK